MEIVRSANVSRMYKKIVKCDKSLEIVGLRISSTEEGDSADSGLKGAVESDGLPSLAHERAHCRRSSFTSWWQMPSRSLGFVQEIKALAVICISRAAFVTAHTF